MGKLELLKITQMITKNALTLNFTLESLTGWIVSQVFTVETYKCSYIKIPNNHFIQKNKIELTSFVEPFFQVFISHSVILQKCKM